MHNTIAFCEEMCAQNVEEYIAGVSDQNARVNGDDIYIGKYNHIISAFGGAQACSYLKLCSPSLRRLFCPYIHPNYSFAPDAHWVMKPVYMSDSPIPLETNEALNALTLSTVLNTDNDSFCGVSLAEGPVAPVSGDIRTMYDEVTGTFTQKTWVNTDFSFPVDLPVGRYQVVGCQVRCTNVGIFRLVPIGADHRPGGMIDAGDKIVDTSGQRDGKMGVWCEFDQLTPPSIEICSAVENAWAAVKLDLIKVG